MTTDAIAYFNSHSPLRSLASRVALHARRGIYARFVALAGTEPGWSISRHRLVGWPSNLILWIPAEASA